MTKCSNGIMSRQACTTLMCVLSLNKSFALTGMPFREHPFLYEKSSAPCKFFLALDFFLLNAIYDLEDLRDRH